MKYSFLRSATSLLVCLVGVIVGDDLPCAARVGDDGQGYVCVCNSTYCDTVTIPGRLDQGLYYLYKTSNSTPGFTRTSGGFIDSRLSTHDVTDELFFTINASTSYQEMIGIGASVTDSTCLNIKDLPDSAQEKLIESYFGPTGIEYSMLRVPIGSTDFSNRTYTLDDVPLDVNLTHFSLADEDINLRIPLIKKASSVSQRDIKLLACTWAAPVWIKDCNKSQPDYTLREYDDLWARYHLRFLEEYQAQGLGVWSVSGGNEGMFIMLLRAFEQPTLNSTQLYAPIQRAWLKNHLKPLLAASNYSHVKFLAFEDLRCFAPYWMERMASDPEAYEAMDGVALHWYADYFTSLSILDDLHASYPDKPILYTETSINGEFGSDAVVLGSWYRAEGYLYNIFENLGHWTSAYLDWNMALDLDGGPTFSYGIDAPVIVNRTSGEFYKQPMFYAMGHVSKFILPGAKRVQVVSNQTESVKTDAKHCSKKSGVDEFKRFIAMSRVRKSRNSYGKSAPIVISVTIPQVVSCLAFSNPDESFSVMVLNTKNETVKVIIEDPRVGQTILSIEKNSINTLVYWP